MATFWIIVLVIVVILYFYFSSENTTVANSNSKDLDSIIKKEYTNTATPQYFQEDNGGKYTMIQKSREVERRTYIHGRLLSKYRGNIDEDKDTINYISKHFPFELYEAVIETKAIDENHCRCINDEKVKCNGIHKQHDGKFTFIPDKELPSIDLPAETFCLALIDNHKVEFKIKNLHNVKINNIKVDRKLHQVEGKEVFGTFESNITGYLLDYVTEYYQEKQYYYDNIGSTILTKGLNDFGTSTTITSRGDRITETFNKGIGEEPFDYKGCLQTMFGTIGIIMGILLLIVLLPSLVYILPFILIPFLLRLLSLNNWFIWLIRFLALLLFMGFLFSIISFFTHNPNYSPTPLPVPKRTDTILKLNDSIIKYTMRWHDYDKKEYVGAFWIRMNDYKSSSKFKENLQEDSYNKMVSELKQNDENSLGGLYQLFDSINKANNLTETKFAEMVVSFVQTIPYTLVLPKACDANLYSDDFIRKYLTSPNARCDGNENFGINTPVEFMATLKGDCDTRTLLLYTILSHYDYNVAMLSSEYYGHSLLGVSLPYDGTYYTYNSEHYTLWETTAPDIRPGIISNQVSNLNYWKISLKSK